MTLSLPLVILLIAIVFFLVPVFRALRVGSFDFLAAGLVLIALYLIVSNVF